VIPLQLSGRIFGIDQRLVRGVEPMEAYTPVPAGPEFLLGMVLVDGTVVAMVDLAWLLGTPSDRSSYRYQVVLRRGRLEVACGVETVGRARRIVPEELTATDDGLYLCLGATLDGMTVIDGEALLAESVLIPSTESDDDDDDAEEEAD